MDTLVVPLRGACWSAILALTLCAAVVGGLALASVELAGTTALLAIAFALLAAASGFTLDEPSAAVVDVVPMSSARRTADRALALTVPFLTGSALAVLTSSRGGPPAFDLAIALVGGQLLAFTLALVGRQRVDEPGAIVAVLVVLLLVIAPMIGVVNRHIHVVPTIDHGTSGLTSNATWVVMIGICVTALVAIGSARSAR